MPWGFLLSIACLASVMMMAAAKRGPRNPANLRLFFVIRMVLLVAVIVLFYLTFFRHPAA